MEVHAPGFEHARSATRFTRAASTSSGGLKYVSELMKWSTKGIRQFGLKISRTVLWKPVNTTSHPRESVPVRICSPEPHTTLEVLGSGSARPASNQGRPVECDELKCALRKTMGIRCQREGRKQGCDDNNAQVHGTRHPRALAR